MNLTEVFTPAALAFQYNSAESNKIEPLGTGFFTPTKKAGLDLAWFKGTKGVPVSLMPSNFDAKATFRDRIGVKKVETEMPFFREGFRISEKDRQEILRATDSSDPYAQAVIAAIYSDFENLVDAAAVVRERMAMQLLFPENGNVGINFFANNVQYTYNYDDSNATWKANNYFVLTGNDKWDAPTTSDPIKNIDTVAKALRSNSGSEPRYAVMNSTTLAKFAASKAVVGRATLVYGANYVTDAEAKAAIERYLGISIITYDKQYKDEGKTSHSYVPDGYVAVVPEGALGKMYFGTTPEEADLAASGKAEVSLVDTGVAITREVTVNPVNVNLFASEICLPSYERMDEVACIKVY